METLTIELTNPKSLNLIHELEELNLIRVVKKEKNQKTKLSSLLRGSISNQAAVEFNNEVKKMREEWDRF